MEGLGLIYITKCIYYSVFNISHELELWNVSSLRSDPHNNKIFLKFKT